MIILRSLRRDWFPSRFFIPVHVIIYVTRSVIHHAAPYTHIPLYTFSEFFFSFLQIQFQMKLVQILLIFDAKLEAENRTRETSLPCQWNLWKHLALTRTGWLSHPWMMRILSWTANPNRNMFRKKKSNRSILTTRQKKV